MNRMRKTIIIFWLAFLFTGILIVFWYMEQTHPLFTPLPDDYTPVQTSEYVAFTNEL